jgi:hypothetical protein
MRMWKENSLFHITRMAHGQSDRMCSEITGIPIGKESRGKRPCADSSASDLHKYYANGLDPCLFTGTSPHILFLQIGVEIGFVLRYQRCAH